MIFRLHELQWPCKGATVCTTIHRLLRILSTAPTTADSPWGMKHELLRRGLRMEMDTHTKVRSHGPSTRCLRPWCGHP